MRVRDRAHRQFFNGGALTTERTIARFRARIKEIDRAVVGESARWGDAKRTATQKPFTRDDTWLPAVNSVITLMTGRWTVVMNQLRTKGFYPAVAAPSFNQHGGRVASGWSLTMTAPAGTILFTLDGSDPRLPGGAVAPTARTYTAPIPLTSDAAVKARDQNGTSWSALNEATFRI